MNSRGSPDICDDSVDSTFSISLAGFLFFKKDITLVFFLSSFFAYKQLKKVFFSGGLKHYLKVLLLDHFY